MSLYARIGEPAPLNEVRVYSDGDRLGLFAPDHGAHLDWVDVMQLRGVLDRWLIERGVTLPDAPSAIYQEAAE